jgi:hypothetical protein
MKLLLTSALLLSIIAALCIAYKGQYPRRPSLASVFTSAEAPAKPAADEAKTRLKAAEALRFCKASAYNTRFCILIDMSVHSGLNRFFIWDFEKDSVTHRFPVSHGCCDNDWNDDQSVSDPKFSNTDGSHCSSLGRYRIGERGYSNWGIHVKYLLHGLDKTNSNALSRQIVFHGWEQTPDTEIYPAGTPEGWGCPTLSNKHMTFTDLKLQTAKAPVLMWIYN